MSIRCCLIAAGSAACLALSSLVPVAISADSSPPPRTLGKKADGEKAHKDKEWAIQGKSPKNDVDFWYYAPSSCPKKNIPMVISYHGASGTGKSEIGSWKALAEDNKFIIVCPTSILAGAGKRAAEQMRVGLEDFQKESETTLSIVEFMNEKFRIDAGRVMVTGFSGGGIPSYWLGFMHPDVFPYVCPRCGNFPPILPKLCAGEPKAAALAQKAATNSCIYVFWGEKDHPIILGEIDKTLEWIASLSPAHFKKEKVAGMGHDGRPQMAVAWFLESMKESERRRAAQPKQ